jgi:cell division protein FtsQ
MNSPVIDPTLADLESGELGQTKQTAQSQALGACFLLLVLVLIGFLTYSTLSWMFDSQRLPLSKVVIQGELEYISEQDVQKALGRVDSIGTFMSQDVDTLQQAIMQLPWSAQVSVRKQWPDVVKVFLVEHRALAIWNGNALLNEYGDVFNADASVLKEDKVKLYGPEGSNQQVLSAWREIKPLFQPLGLTISSLLLNERRAWQIILDNGIRLELGKESLVERAERFITLYHRLGKDVERVSYIDLRYDIGAAVGWFPEQDLEQESKND